MAIPSLPEELLIEIFARLPTKSIGRFRCLSKTWRILLSNPYFIKFHLTQHKSRHKYLLLLYSCLSLHSIETIKNDNNTVSSVLDIPGQWWYIAGSCDGLVLLADDFDEIFLVNPVTLEQVKIPNSPPHLKEGEGSTIYGFGYDNVRDDYKVVAVSYYGELDKSHPDSSYSFVDVFSLKLGAWRRFGRSPYSYCIPETVASGVTINGAIHWLAAGWRKKLFRGIVGFDLVNEAFLEIPVPRDLNVENFFSCTLEFLEGCLCVIDALGNMNGTDFWVMKDYGVAESWVKFSVYGYHLGTLFKPLCIVGDWEEVVFVFVGNGTRLVVYNFKEISSRNLVVDGGLTEFIDGCTFMESLVSPMQIEKCRLAKLEEEAEAAAAATLLVECILLMKKKKE